MRLFIFALIILFPISALAGEEFFSSDWWTDDWWEEETVIEESPQQNIPQQRSIESIQEKLKKLERMIEQKSKRQEAPEYRQRKK